MTDETPDLASLTPADFEAAVGSEFEIGGGESAPLRVRLAEVVVFEPRPGNRQPFVIRFQGPAEPVLAPVVHRVRHVALGELDIFLGPIASSGPGTTYEAVFA